MLIPDEISENTTILYDSIFDALAKELLEDYTLKINGSTYRIIEIEFYLNNIEGKLDPFTHDYTSSKPPYENGQLRWHRSGVDIILRKGQLYGGILLRALKRNDGEVIRGPHKVLEEIFKHFSIHSKSTIEFERVKISSSVKYFKSSRQGLSLKSHCNNQGLEYIHKQWRYLTIPIDSIKDKRSICFNLLEQNIENRKEIISTDSSTIENYKKSIKIGEGLSKNEILRLGNRASEQAQIFGYCKKHFKH